MRIASSCVPVKMSEQAGRERSGGLETSRQKPRLSATQLPKVRDDRARRPAGGHRHTGECSVPPLRRSHGAQLGGSPRKRRETALSARRRDRGVSAILSQKWRPNCGDGSARTPSQAAEGGRGRLSAAAVTSQGASGSVWSVIVALPSTAVSELRAELWRISRSFLLSSPLSSHPHLLLRVCLLAKPVVRMRVTMALLFCRKKTQLALFEFSTTSRKATLVILNRCSVSARFYSLVQFGSLPPAAQ